MYYSIDNFKELVLDIFLTPIKKYSLKVYSCSDHNIKLKNKHILLDIFIEHTDLFIELSFVKKPEVKYHIGAINKALGEPSILIEPNKDLGAYFENSLKMYSKVLENISQVFFNDRSWILKYNQNENDEKSIIEGLGSEFKPSHKIYQKYVDGDSTWKQDLERHIKHISE